MLLVSCSSSPVARPLNVTVWQVIEVDCVLRRVAPCGLRLDDPRLGAATLSTPCSEVTVPFAFDTDGNAVSFGNPIGQTTCVGDAAILDASIARGFATASSWELRRADLITTSGGVTMLLGEVVP